MRDTKTESEYGISTVNDLNKQRDDMLQVTVVCAHQHSTTIDYSWSRTSRTCLQSSTTRSYLLMNDNIITTKQFTACLS